MARVFYVHWDRQEGLEAVKTLRAQGHRVTFHHSTEPGAGARAWRTIRATPPDAIAVSLDRLPSHGRRVAAVTKQYKALRDVPVIFTGGTKEKRDMARREFPQARWCAAASLGRAIDACLP